MPKLAFNEALPQIESGKISSLYYLVGKEKFFHDQFLETIIKKAFPDKASKDLNLTILYGAENNLGEVLSASLSYPMLAQQKMVIVRDFDKMKISDPESLIKYLENPQKTTCLVLVAEDRGRAAVYQTIHKLAQTIECKPIPEYKVGDWIAATCKTKGFAIETSAIQFLINHIGSSLLGINQELNKIIDYKNEQTTITLDDLEQTTGISRDTSVFALQKALSHRKLAFSLKICQRLLETGHDLTMINAVLFAFFRKMLIASSLKQRGQNRQQVGNEMKLSDFQLRDIYDAMKHFSVPQLKAVIQLLHKLDIEAKTSAISSGPGLQMICYKICRI